MSIYLDKTLGKWRATYNFCGRKYRIPGLYMSKEEADSKWTELDNYIQGGCSVEERVYRFFVTVNRKKLERLDEGGLGRVVSYRNSYKYDERRQPGIMYETYLYDKLCDELL